ncbi:hypothetical protein [Niabella drilacis]|uniref:Uncharacterized protein n=1 Tax=Niabella drilacis (strain DSM 25811 / CCM 8410 / CCUG 62505 / LMG 26954 / E90) TaxID=1285928 RepID=A0A1G7BCN5_NIADE|nr:hypothetical protein [Niabella drilacis]SDE24116.1 hypothetical protein SAMN04487894_12838 [Niabella drilacis]
MSVTLENPNLNEQQVLMLRLLTNPLPEADFAQVRRFVVKLLAKQIDSTIEEWEQENNVTEATYEKLRVEHFRSKPRK